MILSRRRLTILGLVVFGDEVGEDFAIVGFAFIGGFVSFLLGIDF